jgi:hypothetical protein
MCSAVYSNSDDIKGRSRPMESYLYQNVVVNNQLTGIGRAGDCVYDDSEYFDV